ncbi:MAG: hypothetical protein QXW98_07785, partial [Candidatus Caldarchaeum sp.]
MGAVKQRGRRLLDFANYNLSGIPGRFRPTRNSQCTIRGTQHDPESSSPQSPLDGRIYGCIILLYNRQKRRAKVQVRIIPVSELRHRLKDVLATLEA